MCSRQRWVSSLVLFLILFGLLFPGGALAGSNMPAAPVAVLPIPPFDDVLGTEYQEDVGVLWQIGVAGGTSQTTFSPWEKVTRAQAAAFIMRALKRSGETVSGPLRFTDVPTNHYAANAILLADRLGIIKGTSASTFEPDGYVTHAQLATMLLRALNYESQITGEWPVSHVLKAKEVGLLDRIPFELSKEATRAETARFLVNAIFKVSDATSRLTLSQTLFKWPAALKVSPADELVTTSAVTLSAEAVDWFGNPFNISDVRWSVLSGSGTLVGSRLIMEGSPVTVKAESGTVSATRQFQYAKSLQITPANPIVRPSQTVQLDAAAVLADNSSRPVTPIWSVVSGPATVSASGLVTMTGAGSATIKATYLEFSQQVTVLAAGDMAISPAAPVVAVGESVSLTAQVTSNGTTKEVPATWSIVSGDGKITSDGLYIAGRKTTVIQASAPGFTATTTINVINKLEITPAAVTLSNAETTSFSVKAYTAEGQLVPNVQAKLTLSNRTLGVLEDSGTFVATGSGRGTVTATYRGLTATANVAVAGAPAAMRVTASAVSLPANGATQAVIKAEIVDTNGIPVRGDRTISFSTNGNLATLDKYAVSAPDGVAETTLTAGTGAGTVSIFASAPGVASGQTQVTLVAPSPNRVVLSAYPPVINADAVSTTTITATLVDSAGKKTNNISGNSIPVFLVSNGNNGILLSTSLNIAPGSSTATTQFRSNAYTGSTTISGSSSFPVDPVTVQTTIVGAAAKLGVRNIEAVEANGTTAMTITVEVQDSAGVLRSTDSTQLVVLQATGPSTLTFIPQTVVQGVATFRATTTVAGTYTFTASSSNLSPTTANGQFKPGRAAKLLLSAEPQAQIAADTVSSLTLVAKVADTNGNLVTNHNPQITFHKTSNGNSFAWTGDTQVIPVNGVAKLPVRSTAYPGTESFTASASGIGSATPLDVQTVITGVASKVRVQPITGTSVGNTTTVQVKVFDSRGYLVTNDNGRMVSIVTDSSTAVTNSPQPTVNGVATFTITNNKAQAVKVSASSAGLDPDDTGATFTFTSGPAERIILVADPPGIAAAMTSRARITAYAVDSLGNRVNNGYSVNLTLNGTTQGTLSQAIIHTFDGSYTYFNPNGNLGSVTISGTASIPVSPVTVTTYQPGVPSRVVVETTPSNPLAGTSGTSSITVKAKVLDSNGNVATWLTSGLDLTHMGLVLEGANTATGTTTTSITSSYFSSLASKGFTADGITRGAVPVVNGEATFSFSNTKAQTVTLTPYVWYNNVALPVTSGQVTTVAGPATQLTSNPTSLTLPSNTAMPSSVIITLADRYGNPVAGGTDTITVTQNNNSFISLPGGNTYTLDNSGSVSVPVSSIVSATGGTTRLTFRAVRANVTSDVTVTTDLPPDAPSVSFSTGSVTWSNGALRVYVDARNTRNAAQNILLFVNGLQVNMYETAALDPNQKITHIAPGTLTAAGYIRVSDMGGPGVKSVQAYLVTDLGISQGSPVFTITVTP